VASIRKIVAGIIAGAIIVFIVGILALLVLAFAPSDSPIIPQKRQEVAAGWIGAGLIVMLTVGALVATPWFLIKEIRKELRLWQSKKHQEAKSREREARQEVALSAPPIPAAKALLGRDLDDDARLKILGKLEGHRNEKQIVDVLVKLARRPRNPKEHIEVLALLGSSVDPRAFPPIFESFVKSNRPNNNYLPEAFEVWRAARAALLEHGNEAMALFALEESARMSEPDLRINAISLACEIGGRTLFEKVLQAMGSRELLDYVPSEPMRLLIDGLKHRSDPFQPSMWKRADEEWIREKLEHSILRSRCRTVRLAAAFGLEELRDPASVPVLKKATQDRDPAVRKTAMQALASFPRVAVD
jgi:hypothetical protein